jgi:SSS family transporter
MGLVLNEVTGWDYAIVVGYFSIILLCGFLFSGNNKNASDYFRGGGHMVWWVTGVSAIMSLLSTWSLVAAAAKDYSDGFFLALSLWIADIVSIIMLFKYAHLFRRMRVITSAEGIRRRFGSATEQIVSWAQIIYSFNYGAVMLYTLSIFISAVFGFDLKMIILLVGVVVTVMSVSGGSWAVASTDFIQGLILFTVVFLVVFKMFTYDEIGGITGYIEKLPENVSNLTYNIPSELLYAWILMTILNCIFRQLSIQHDGLRFLAIKDDKELKKMILFCFVPFGLLGFQFILHIPAVGASFLFPEIGEVFPNLETPTEGAFVAVALSMLPSGMIGLVICAMFAASMSSLDSALNRNSGLFVRSVYYRYINREASDEKQVRVAKISTAFFGCVIVIFAIFLDTFREMNLFYLTMYIGLMNNLPVMVAMGMGILVKKTPTWSGWSTVLIIGICLILIKLNFAEEWVTLLFPDVTEFNERSRIEWELIYMSFSAFIIGPTWFIFTKRYYKYSSKEHCESLEALIRDMQTPVISISSETKSHEESQYKMIGIMCIALGFMLLAGILIPNEKIDRLLFLATGGGFLFLGTFLTRFSRKFK